MYFWVILFTNNTVMYVFCSLPFLKYEDSVYSRDVTEEWE